MRRTLKFGLDRMIKKHFPFTVYNFEPVDIMWGIKEESLTGDFKKYSALQHYKASGLCTLTDVTGRVVHKK